MAAVFDKPTSEKTVALPPDADYGSDGLVRCFYYPGFMVKEVDMREKGADKLSITPIAAGQAVPCQRDDPNEMVAKDWSGYFAGVKGRYVFFAADDGYDGAMQYTVFDRNTGNKLFKVNVDDPNDASPFHSLSLSGDALTILYRRAFSANCSLYGGKSDCWNKVKKS